MNLNLAVFPNNPGSMKLKGRNLPELHLDAVQLDDESRFIESRLQQLREDMSREKEERERAGGVRWRSVKATSQAATKTKESSFQKLSAGKVKLRVLKGEPEGSSRPAGKVPRPPPGELAGSRKPRLRGKPCGQCEAQAARLMCAECGEDYCVGCFARFHQKGALKNHRMVPIQMEIQTSISALDVVSQFKRQIGPEGSAVNNRRKDGNGSQGALRRNSSLTTSPAAQGHAVGLIENNRQQLLLINDGVMEESEEADIQGSQKLLLGAFDEKESERSFQEALWEWRGNAGASESGAEQEVEPETAPEDAWGVTETVRVPTEVFSAQADLVQTGRPIEVEFKQHGLSYMERLLLKKHRRTPIEEYRLLPSVSLDKESEMDSCRSTEEESLTAEEVEMQRYCASLFAVDTALPTTTSTSTSASTLRSSSPPSSSNQPDHRPKSRLNANELMAGDSAALNSTITAELEMDSAMMVEGVALPMEPGHQETKRNKGPCVPSTPSLSSPITVNQSVRHTAPTPPSQKRSSHSTHPPQASTPPSPVPPSPNLSTSVTAREVAISQPTEPTKPTLSKASRSAPCQARRPLSAIATRPSPPSYLTSRPKSAGPSVLNPLPSRFKITGPSSVDSASDARTYLSSPPGTPVSSMSISAESLTPDFTPRSRTPASPSSTARSSMSITTGALAPTPLSSRGRSAESPTPDFTSRSKTPVSLPLTVQSYRSISAGLSTLTPRSFRDKDESPQPDSTSRSKTRASPASTVRSFRSLSNGPSAPRRKSCEMPPPEQNFRDISCHSVPLELVPRNKSMWSPPSQGSFESKSTRSLPPTPLSSRDKSSLCELELRGVAPVSLAPEMTFVDKLPRSAFHGEDFRDKSLQSPAPELSCRDKSPGKTLSENDLTDQTTRLPRSEMSFGEQSPESFVHRQDFKEESRGSLQAEMSINNKSLESPQPELLSEYESSESSPPTSISSMSGAPIPTPVELPSVSQPEHQTSLKTVISVRLPQSTFLLEPAQAGLTQSSQSPQLLKAASASRSSPAQSTAPQTGGESASSSDARRSTQKPLPRRGDEEINGRTALQAQGREEPKGQRSQAPEAARLGPKPEGAVGRGSDAEQELGVSDTPAFLSDPSPDLHNQTFRSLQYTGLEGFLTLGLDAESDCTPPSPLSVHESQGCQDPAECLVRGLDSWRPSSSLRDCANEQLVLSVMRSQPISTSPRLATPRPGTSPLLKAASSAERAVEARPRSSKTTPRSSRPVTADLSGRPDCQPLPGPGQRPRPQSSPGPRAQSRAAEEISEIEKVDGMECADSLLWDEADCLALENLEEEFRLMSETGTCSSDPGASSLPRPPGLTGASRQRPSAKREDSSEGYVEEELELLRDRQNVMSLP